MNIFKVNGVRQFDRPNDKYEQKDKDIPLPQ